MSKDNNTKDLGNCIDKSDPDYGKPQKGTKTELRGQKAHSHVHKVGRAHNLDKITCHKEVNQKLYEIMLKHKAC